MTDYLFNTLQQRRDCGVAEYDAAGCPDGFSRNGRFPQNAWVSGAQYWQGTQMDEQAMPILLAWRQGPAVYSPLWPRIKLAADYILSAGPWVPGALGGKQRLFAVHAGGADRRPGRRRRHRPRQRRRRQRRALSVRRRLLAAKRGRLGLHPQRRLWRRPLLSAPQSVRARRRASRAGQAPALGPDTPQTLEVKNGGGGRDARRVVDGGFLELVRMG